MRQLVSQLAVGALIGGFDADGAIVAWQAEGVGEPEVAAELSAPWRRVDGPGFALAARMGALLDRKPNGAELDEDWPAPVQFELDDRSVWVGRQDAGSMHLVSAIVRVEPLAANDDAPLGSLLRSVAAAMAGERYSAPPGSHLSVSTEPQPDPQPDQRSGIDAGDDMVRAVVGLGADGERGRITATGRDAPTAIANAAVQLLSEAYTVEFAGQSLLTEGRQVTLVVLAGPGGAPIVGLSIDPPRTQLGPAAAVLNAAQSVGVMPELDAGRVDARS